MKELLNEIIILSSLGPGFGLMSVGLYWAGAVVMVLCVIFALMIIGSRPPEEPKQKHKHQ